MHNECRMRELPGLQIIPPGVEDQQTNCNNQGYALPTHNNQYSLANTRRKDNEGDCSHRKLYRDPHIDKDVNREIADAFDEMVSEEPSDADSIVVVLGRYFMIFLSVFHFLNFSKNTIIVFRCSQYCFCIQR